MPSDPDPEPTGYNSAICSAAFAFSGRFVNPTAGIANFAAAQPQNCVQFIFLTKVPYSYYGQAPA